MKYYDVDKQKVLESLETSEDGLSSDEAKARLTRYGANKLKETNKKSNISKFFDQFKDLMIIILIVAAIFSAISSYLNHESYTDTIVILAVVIINAISGYVAKKVGVKS